VSIDRISQAWESPNVVVGNAKLSFEVVGEDLKLDPGILRSLHVILNYAVA
jgi:hypothetical protein